VSTPQPVIDKINKAFALWASDPEARLKFAYKGLTKSNYKSMNEVPDEGCIYIMFDGESVTGASVSGIGGYEGAIPGDYKKGLVVMDTTKGLYTLSYNALTHEIGHALGIGHAVSTPNIMLCGTKTWGDAEYLTYSEQDRADLRALWAPQSVYTVKGVVYTKGKKEHYMVYAVNIKNGHTYSVLSGSDGSFDVNILKEGGYRIFAKGYELSEDEPMKQCPSWYISNTDSTNDPYTGTVIEVGKNKKAVSGIKIIMIDKQVPFNMTHSMMVGRNYEAGLHCFLTPGSHTEMLFLWIGEGALRSVKRYGTNPDYDLSDLKWNKEFKSYTVDVKADRFAEDGERLVIAKGDSGVVQAGLVGINVVRKAPRMISKTDDMKSQEYGPMTPAAQFMGLFDFTSLDQDYWKK